jgi:hypothetical protein
MSERTTGRLAVEDDTDIVMEDGTTLCDVVYATDSKEVDAATARHLVAAWNAAEALGLTTEQLEAGVLAELVAVLELVRERDDQALTVMSDLGLDLPKTEDMEVVNAIRDVLAKIGK